MRPTPGYLSERAAKHHADNQRIKARWLEREDERWAGVIVKYLIGSEGGPGPLHDLRQAELERHLADGWTIISGVLRQQYGPAHDDFIYLRRPA